MRMSRGGGLGGPPVYENEAVQKELKLTDDQIEKLRGTQPDRSQMGPLMGRLFGGTEEDKAAAGQELGELAMKQASEQIEKIKEILSDRQFTRYREAEVQQQGIRALLDPLRQQALELSEEQAKKLGEFAMSMMGRTMQLRALSGDERDAARRELEDEALAILDDSQRKRFLAMRGKPIEGLESGFAPRDGELADGPSPDDEPKPTRELIAMPQLTDDPTVASFGGEPNAAAATEAEPNQPRSLRFSFQNAPWDDVLKLFAQSAGLTLDMETRPEGAFTYLDPQDYTPTEALDILNGYLIPRGFVLLKRNQFLVVRKIADGLAPDLIPTVARESLASRGENEVVRTIFETGTLPAGDFVEDVKSLLGPQGTAVGLGTSNRIVVQGLTRNLRQVDEFLSGAIRPPKKDELAFRAFPLKHVTAGDIEPMVRTLLGVDASIKAESDRTKARDPREAFAAMIAQQMNGGRGRGGSSEEKKPTGTARVTIDSRTNSVLVTATPPELEIVSQMVEQVDVPEGIRIDGASGGPRLQMYKVTSGDIDEISETLTAMLPAASINVDGRSETLHVIATDDTHERVAQLLRELGSSDREVAVLTLARMDAADAELLVESLFTSDDVEPSLMSDPTGRRLIVRGSPSQIREVEKMLTDLGELGPRQGGRVREIPLNGQDATEAAELLRQMYEGRGGKVRIIDRSSRRPKATTGTPSQTTEKTGGKQSDPAGPAGPAGPVSRRSPQPAAIPTWFVQQNDAAGTAPDGSAAVADEGSDGNGGGKGNGDNEVSIVVQDGRLIVTSPDEDALDELESIADVMLESTTPRSTQWNVYYLDATLATETADFLERVFPDALVVKEGKVLIARSESLLGRELIIVPEERANALYVSGTPSDLRELEEVLELVDAAERPDAARDRTPRSIAVESADLGQVFEVVSSVYADKLPQAGGENGPPLAGQMTVAVDATTSRLIVSTDANTFEEVESLVRDLDEAARDARRSVRVVQLRNTDAAQLQSMLGTLMPKVSFTASGAPAGGGPPQRVQPVGRPGPPEASGGGDDRSDIRRFFEERARRRAESGEGGGRPDGDRGGERGGDRGGFGRGDRGGRGGPRGR